MTCQKITVKGRVSTAMVALGLTLASAGTAYADNSVDYDMGYDSGLVIQQIYPDVTSRLQLQQLCNNAVRNDILSARQINAENGSTISISVPDYLAGCADAVGIS